MKNKICYRFVKEDMTSNKDGVTKWKIGKWNKVEGKLKCCSNGLHASLTPRESLNNIYGDRWFIAEYRGNISKEDDKFCANEMRLIKEIPIIVIKRFALFCAKQCLKNYEKQYPDDKRVSECIRITELYLDGKATLKELSAAESAAWSTARSAAWSAAWFARYAAESAALSAARSARYAAESAAWSAAESAALSAQNKELLRLIKEYAK